MAKRANIGSAGLFGDTPPLKRTKSIPAEKAVEKEIVGKDPGFTERVFSIAEFIEILNVFFRAKEVRITGEISELKRAASGHIYFTIKDKKDGAVLDAIMWSRNYQLCGVALEVGMEVILAGHPNIYPQNGRLSFVADTVELVGEGALKKAYDALKNKLSAEGIFEESRKRPLPEFPHKIGVITSLKGAVIHDFENNLGKFGFVVNVVDARVEGQQALVSLLDSFAALRKIAEEDDGRGLDALVVIRGGGSLESLQAFNNEAIVRAIVEFPVPVIAGIGHDKDVPLAALAADYMTSTPTAAAHLLNRSWEEAYAKVYQLNSVFVRMQQELKRIRTDLDIALATMIDSTASRIKWMAEQIDYAERFIKLNNPKRQLKLGYSIARKDGKILRSAGSVKPGDDLETEFADGTVRSIIQ
jgi:exodeoxyribonuclease VII large subunit